MSDRERKPAPGRPTRRAFLGALAAAPLAPAAVSAQTPPPSPTPPPSGSAAVAEALVEAVKREFGAYLDAADLDAVKKQIEHGLDTASRLRQAARLGNADEPVTRFEALPAVAAETGAHR
jgi:lipoprotein-anchoring transpeptidase ErfK/SrfK